MTPEKRRQYDQFGHAAFDGGAGGAGAGGFDFSGMDFGDMFGDIFGDFFGGGSRRGASNGPMKGANLRTSVRITFEEAVFGCEKEIDMVLKDRMYYLWRNRSKTWNFSGDLSRNAVEKVKLYFPSNLCSAWFRTFRPVRNVTDTGKIIKDRCPSCRGTGYTSSRKEDQSVYSCRNR